MVLGSGVNLDDRDDGDQTALHRAAGFGHASVVAFLLDSNGKVSAKPLFFRFHLSEEREGCRFGATVLITARFDAGGRCR